MEFVFVVPRSALFPGFYPQGFWPLGSDLLGSTGVAAPLPNVERNHLEQSQLEQAIANDGFFVERAYAERTPTLKQIIPYSIVECDGQVLLTRRLQKGGEARLHGKSSIGIGGHINPEDLEGLKTRNPVEAGTRREIAEELAVRGDYTVRRVGLLNDDSNPVGAVHLGVVQVVHVRGSVEIRERDQLEGRLVPCEELSSLLKKGANFETWSTLLIPHVDELILKPLAAHS
jgi:predicted NUDIX family phosphoesterase